MLISPNHIKYNILIKKNPLYNNFTQLRCGFLKIVMYETKLKPCLLVCNSANASFFNSLVKSVALYQSFSNSHYNSLRFGMHLQFIINVADVVAYR